MCTKVFLSKKSMKQMFKIQGKNFCAFVFSVHKVTHYYDLDTKFKQKTSKMKQIQFPREKWRETEEEKISIITNTSTKIK